MAGPWDIKIPPPLQPLLPVRPGDAIRDGRDKHRQPPREQREQPPEHEPPQDDGQTHIDDYA